MNSPAQPLRAYHGDKTLKQETVDQARAHREADEFVQGVYFFEDADKREVCAVGCLTHDPDGGHDQYPERWGIPEWLAYLEDRIFEGLPIEKAKLWPERFLAAIPVGADFDGLMDRLATARSARWAAAARSARSAESAARSARSAAAARSARSAAAAYEREADRLIAELEKLPASEAAG